MKLLLTENEKEALRICLNYDSRESQLDDNYSNGGPYEFALQLFDGNMKAAGGLISSLQKKGLGWLDDRTDEGFGRRPASEHIFWLSSDGVNAIFDIIEEEGK